MSILLGVDTGGTYTDAVLIRDETEVIAAAKSLTTRDDLSRGIGKAVRAVLARSGTAPSDISMASLSTTLATNALVEGQGGQVALILIGFDEKDAGRQGLLDALKDDPVLYIAGGHTHAGDAAAELDLAALDTALGTLAPGISGFAIAGQFATRNPEHEVAVRDLVRDKTGKPVSCSHELSAKLGGPKRAVTALLNARLIGMIARLIDACDGLLSAQGIGAPLMVVRGDGALIAADQAREKPIETILSGPAASIVGARWLSDVRDALVSDIGGTTTDVALLRDGRPKIDPDGARVGGIRTMVEAVAMRTTGLGGDSEVHVIPDGLSTRLRLGPRRVMPLSLLATSEPDLVAKSLEGDLGDLMPGEHAGRFVVPLVDAADGLPAREAKVFDRFARGPVALSDIVSNRLELVALDRLVARGFAIISAVTPSDAAHVLGLTDAWDRAAAELGLSLFAKQRNGAGAAIGQDADGIARAIIAQLTRQTCDILLETAFAEETGFDTPAATLARHELMQAGMDGGPRIVRLDAGLSIPVVGLGASAPAYYEAVGARLGTRMILPEHAGVANAIGAVVGQITMRETGEVETAGEGAFRAFVSGGPKLFGDQATALSALEDDLTEKARQKAQSAGAVDIRVRTETDVQTAQIEGRANFVSAHMIVTASGRPRIASE